METNHESVGFNQNVWDGDNVSHFGFVQVGFSDGDQDQGVSFVSTPAWTHQGIGGSKPKKKTGSEKPSAIAKVPSKNVPPSTTPKIARPAYIKSVLKSKGGRLICSTSRVGKGVQSGESSTKAGRDVYA